METHSQHNCFQDIFALFINNNSDSGYSIDIGCRNKIGNNSVLLLKKGWKGVGADIDDYTNEWNDYPGFFHCMDVTAKENIDTLFKNAPSIINFLSLDVDEASLQCLLNIDFTKYKFKCICIEHDFYLHGEKLRKSQREILEQNKYIRVIQTVAEDWWIYPDLIDPALVEILNRIPDHPEFTESEMPLILEWLNIKQ